MALQSPRFNRSSRILGALQNSPTMKHGERGEAVAVVQQALADLGFPMPVTTAHGKKYADGIFGKETEKTVRSFQDMNGLSADGIVGTNTLQVLDDLIATFFGGQVVKFDARQALPARSSDIRHGTLRG